MNKPPHADIIHAWADGKQIQYKCTDGWVDTVRPAFHMDGEYRVKPTKRAIHYRRYIVKHCETFFTVETITKGTYCIPSSIEALPEFYKWIDNDWQTVEID